MLGWKHLPLAHHLAAAVAQWLRWRTCAQRASVQFPLVPIRVISGSRKGIRPNLLPCTSRSPTSVGTSEPLSKGVNDVKWKKCSEKTQTLRTGCSKAEPKFFAPLQTPFPAVRDGQTLISWRWSLPSPTDPVWWGSMHTVSSYRGNRPTNKHSHKPTDRTDYNTLRRS